jgi:hypothetical protein
MPEAESDYRSITVREHDLEALKRIAEQEFGTNDVSHRTVIRRLISDFQEVDDE